VITKCITHIISDGPESSFGEHKIRQMFEPRDVVLNIDEFAEMEIRPKMEMSCRRLVSFLDIGENDDVFIVGCDWCSIVNGIVETARQNIRGNDGLLSLIDFERLKIADGYLDFILCNRAAQVTQAQTVRWCQATLGDCKPDLLLFS
jgi:hypothetical protein